MKLLTVNKVSVTFNTLLGNAQADNHNVILGYLMVGWCTPYLFQFLNKILGFQLNILCVQIECLLRDSTHTTILDLGISKSTIHRMITTTRPFSDVVSS